MGSDRRPSDHYALGHSDDEIDRLETQARIVDPITRRLWLAAGVETGMKVLDVGCGAGHTTLLLADLVGEHGSVVGIDNAADAVTAAQARSHGVNQVSYVVADPTRHQFGLRFDAVVGRYVLMFQADQAAFLNAVAQHAQTGGIVAFHELDANGVTSRPPVASYDRIAQWNIDTTRRYGADPHCGSRLVATYLAAGLAAPTVVLDTVHGRGAGALDVLTRIRNLARSLLPEMERHAVATAEDVGIDTLLDRMLAETTQSDSIIVGHLEAGAYCLT
jgi:predicted O-methyltransferase YrrM